MACLLIAVVTEFLCAISARSYLGYQIFKDHLIFFFSKGKVFLSLIRLTGTVLRQVTVGLWGTLGMYF